MLIALLLRMFARVIEFVVKHLSEMFNVCPPSWGYHFFTPRKRVTPCVTCFSTVYPTYSWGCIFPLPFFPHSPSPFPPLPPFSTVYPTYSWGCIWWKGAFRITRNSSESKFNESITNMKKEKKRKEKKRKKSEYVSVVKLPPTHFAWPFNHRHCCLSFVKLIHHFQTRHIYCISTISGVHPLVNNFVLKVLTYLDAKHDGEHGTNVFRGGG